MHDSQDGGLRQKVAWLIAVRAVIVTILLGSAIVTQITAPGTFPVDPLFFLIGLIMAVIATLLAYITQMLTTEHGGGVIPPVSKRVRRFAILSAFLSLAGFATGAVATAVGIAG